MARNGTWGDGLPKDGPFLLSESTNILQAIGCNIQVDLWERGDGSVGTLVASCTATCPVLTPGDPASVFPYPVMPNDSCAGLGCCKADIILGYSSYFIQVHQRTDLDLSLGLMNSIIYILSRDVTSDMNATSSDGRAMLDWIISNSSCPTNASAPQCCSTNSLCQNYISRSGTRGYRCQCSRGYQGNPYVPDGCQGRTVEKSMNFIIFTYQIKLPVIMSLYFFL